jgi:hypothetical protein
MELLMKMQFSWLYYSHVYWTRVILFILPVVHAIFNPVVYFIMSRNFRTSVVNKCTECPPTCCQKRSAHAGSFEDLPTLQLRQNRAKSLLATPGHSETNGKTYSTTVVHHPTKVQSNKELVVVHANGELTLDLIEKCEEAV